MTATTMAVWIPEVQGRAATITYRAETVNVPLLDHTWEDQLRAGGTDTVNIPGFSQNSAPNNRGAGAGTFGTGASITYDEVREVKVALVVNRWYYKADRHPFELEKQQIGTYQTLLARGRGQAIQLQVDADIAADNTNGYDSGTVVGSDNVDVTEDDVFTLQTNLNNQNAPVNGRKMVVSPATHSSMMKDEGFRNSLYAGALGNLDGAKGQGYVGKVLTFDVYMSNNLESGTAGKKNAAFQTEAIAYAEQAGLTPEMNRILSTGGFVEFMTWQTCGFKVIKSAFLYELDGK